jgi:hypothetical protein
MLPTIPVVNFVLKHESKPFIEEFESFGDLLDFTILEIPEVYQSMRVEYYNADDFNPSTHSERMFRDYAGDHLEQFLGENGYILSRVVKG